MHILARVTVMAVLLLCGREALADPVVERRMKGFYEVYTGRSLTESEIRDITREFIAGHASAPNASTESIREVARQFGLSMIVLREEPGHPAALSMRDRTLELNYFRPDMQGTLELRLMTEPDPVRVVDTRAKRLMTESDIVALANLRRFARTTSDPQHSDVSGERVQQIVSLLNERIGEAGATLPPFFTEAAAYWAGVRQQWLYLNTQQRTLARNYAARAWRVSMPSEMYASLWGLDPAAASSRWTNDVSARIRGKPDPLIGLAALDAALDAALPKDARQ
jgi:hypothetical protein